MKKTLFLSAILATALCSSAFGETATVTVNGQTYEAAIVADNQTTKPEGDVHAFLFNYNCGNSAETATYRFETEGSTKTRNPWIGNLTNEDTLIFAATDNGTTPSYTAHKAFFDTGDKANININANIIAGGSGGDDLHFWSDGVKSVSLNGLLTLAGNQLQIYNHNGTNSINGDIAGSGKTLKITGGATLNVTGNATLGTFNANGGTINLSGTSAITTLQATGNSTTTVTGGGRIDTIHSSATGAIININNNVTTKFVRSQSGTINLNSAITFAGTGNFVLQVDAAAKLNLKGNATYTVSGKNGGAGVAVGNGATLTVGGTATLNTDRIYYTDVDNNNGSVIVEQGGRLTATGTAQSSMRNLTVNGTVSFNAAELHAANITIGSEGALTVKQLTQILTAKASGSTPASYIAPVVENNGQLTLTQSTALNTNSGATVTNNGTINFSINAAQQDTDAIREENGYEYTGKMLQVTLGSNTAISGTGIWKIDNNVAKVDGNTVTAYLTDTTGSYFIDKADATYVSSLASKYVVAAGKKLTATGDVKNIQVKGNSGTLVLDNVTGYFINGKHAMGDVEIVGTLTLNNGYSKDSSGVTDVNIATINNLIGDGTISTTSVSNVSERTVIAGDVDSTISFSNTRSGGTPTFAFTKDAEKVVLNSISNTGNGSLHFEANALEVNSLTLRAGTVGVYGIDKEHSAANETSITTTNLTVSGNSRLNADLVVSGGTMTFADNAVLTMGCTVSIGDDVTVVLTQDMVDSIYRGEWVEIIASVDGIATLGHTSFTGAGFDLEQPTAYHLTQIGDKIYITPEPATATLSLLALAALASRRRRH